MPTGRQMHNPSQTVVQHSLSTVQGNGVGRQIQTPSKQTLVQQSESLLHADKLPLHWPETQALLMQVVPAEQMAPQLPQLPSSSVVSTQLPSQQRKPSPQARPQRPQFFTSLRNWSRLTHAARQQISLLPQTWPHAPQLNVSVCTFAHWPLQQESAKPQRG